MRSGVLLLFLAFLSGCGEDTSFQGREMEEWLSRLHHPHESVRKEASLALGRIGEPAVSLLREKLQDKEPRVRFAAVAALSKMYASAEEALPELIDLLIHEEETDILILTVRTVGKMGGTGGPSAPLLVPFLKSDNSTLRYHAAKALCRIGEEADYLVEEVAPLLEDPDVEIRREVANRISNMRSSAAIPSLLAALKDEDRKVRLHAGTSIRQLDREVAAQFGVW